MNYEAFNRYKAELRYQSPAEQVRVVPATISNPRVQPADQLSRFPPAQRALNAS
jgi:hypothetical protein